MQKKSEQYFAFEVNMLNNENVSRLIEAYGPRGYGAYVMILGELRLNPGYTCGTSTLSGISRRGKIPPKLLESVLRDFGLFTLREEGGALFVSSPYLSKVMEKYDKKISKLSESGKKSLDKVDRNGRGRFTGQAGVLDKIRLDNNKTTTDVVAKEHDHSSSSSSSHDHSGKDNAGIKTGNGTGQPAPNPLKSWKEYLGNAAKDEEWMTLLAMNSGLGGKFAKYREQIIAAFSDHIQLQGTGANIQSENDIRAYFANYLRPGTPTHKRITAQLAEREEELQGNTRYCYETVDPVTGKRSYHGREIPDSAPPRPGNTAIWSHEKGKWT